MQDCQQSTFDEMIEGLGLIDEEILNQTLSTPAPIDAPPPSTRQAHTS